MGEEEEEAARLADKSKETNRRKEFVTGRRVPSGECVSSLLSVRCMASRFANPSSPTFSLFLYACTGLILSFSFFFFFPVNLDCATQDNTAGNVATQRRAIDVENARDDVVDKGRIISS